MCVVKVKMMDSALYLDDFMLGHSHFYGTDHRSYVCYMTLMINKHRFKAVEASDRYDTSSCGDALKHPDVDVLRLSHVSNSSTRWPRAYKTLVSV